MSNNPLGNFAAAASAKSNNPKVSSAELLSMLKKPTASATTATNPLANTATATTTTVPAPPTIIAPQMEPPIEAFKDDYSLQSLVDLIKACPSDRNIFSIGVDLERTGLAFNQTEPLRESIHSPWFDGSFESLPSASAAGSTLMGMNRVAGGSTSGRSSPLQQQSILLQGRRPSTLDSILPACYSVSSLPPPAAKITQFADETLFYIFFSMPGDRMQDLAARELNNRSWRFYKPAKTWITPVEGETGHFLIFDQTSWIKVKRAMTISPADLEEARSNTSSSKEDINNNKFVMHGSGTLQSQSVTH